MVFPGAGGGLAVLKIYMSSPFFVVVLRVLKSLNRPRPPPLYIEAADSFYTLFLIIGRFQTSPFTKPLLRFRGNPYTFQGPFSRVYPFLDFSSFLQRFPHVESIFDLPSGPSYCLE